MTIKIWINGEQQAVDAATLDRLIEELAMSDAVVATAVNGEFVSQAARLHTPLATGDRIEILAPMQGG